MSSHAKQRCSAQEYLELERRAATKSEFFAGEIFAMTGASRDHNLIVANLVRELTLELKGRPCETYPSDMRVKVNATGLYTYPDLAVVCGPPQFDDEQKDTLLNPTLIVEVLSISTEAYDRGKKFAHYRKIGSLAEVLLVSQDKPHVDRYVRQPENQWLLAEWDGLQSRVLLTSIDCRVDMAEIYDKVELTADSPE
jgi:Uma2 family endonuclease